MKDKANIDAGIIPDDILSDEKVSNSLPMFFRTIRSEKPTPEELDRLIDMIRKECHLRYSEFKCRWIDPKIYGTLLMKPELSIGLNRYYRLTLRDCRVQTEA